MKFNPKCFEKPTGAIFSPCRKYRYVLWRRWGFESRRLCAFVGLNPSTADETKDDPTIRRCIRFCRDWGFDGYVMLNAYAFRATDPRVMKAEPEPIGPENDYYLFRVARECEEVIVAWGNHCSEDRKNEAVKVMNRSLMCLGITASAQPKHPLYLKASTKPELFLQVPRPSRRDLLQVITDCMDPDRFVCKIRYQSDDGEVTDRFVSPITIQHQGTILNALCLSRQEPRNFTLSSIIKIRRYLASDVIMPVPITIITKSLEGSLNNETR